MKKVIEKKKKHRVLTRDLMIQTGAGKTKASGNWETNVEAKGNRAGEGGTAKTRARTKRSGTQVNILYYYLLQIIQIRYRFSKVECFREMERQRQLEWERQKSQELQAQRQKEQDVLLKLKAKNQTLSIELGTLVSKRNYNGFETTLKRITRVRIIHVFLYFSER